jgi:phospholipase/carboxylesterase
VAASSLSVQAHPVTSIALLPAVEIETGPAPAASVIFLHGLGDDGNGWSGAVNALRIKIPFAVRYVFPHAPVIGVTLNAGHPMRAWYDIRDADLNRRADLDGVRSSQAHVERLIARENGRGIPDERIVLGGFSQGGAVALYAGLRHPRRLAGLIALSTYLVEPQRLLVEAASVNRGLPIFMAHGTQDPVVQYAWGESSRRSLEEGGWPVEWHAYAMEHSAVPEEIVAMARFIERVLRPSPEARG